MRTGFGRAGKCGVLVAILCMATAVQGAAPRQGATFGDKGNLYDADVANLGIWDAVSAEVWFRMDAACPAGAVILDKLGPGTGQGIRLETAAAGKLRLVTSAPTAIETKEGSLRAGEWAHVVTTFDPRTKVAAIYIDGKSAATLSMEPSARITIIGSQTPVRLGADQLGAHRFVGTIASLGLFDKALTAGEVADLESGKAVPHVGAWQLGAAAARRIEATEGKGMLVAVPDIRGATQGPGGALTLWYDRPAREWLESLAFGNGRMGGTVFGGVEHERVQLNEDTIWTGAPYDPANPGAPEAIAKARELLFAGKQKEAESLIESSAMGLPKTMAVYQTLGNLELDFANETTPITDYRRSLDVDSAVTTTTFTRGGVTFTRQVFASAPDQVVVVRLTADRPGSLSFRARMTTPFKDATTGVKDGMLSLSGQGGPFNGKPGAIRFQSFARVENEGGTTLAEGDSLRVEKADAVTMLVACGTNYVNYHDVSADPDARARRDLEAAKGKGYAALRTRHVEDYQRLFHRVTLDVGTGPGADLPTDERIRRFDGRDTSLAALYFQFGRYLLISSSRPGGQPANLQGLWNDALSAAWGGKYTININTEENYWPAEATNLSECAQPLFAMVHDLSMTGAHTAEVMYHAQGWVCHHNTDLWRATAPIDSAVGFWPMGGAWLTTHLWEHYQFTKDRAFLEQAYPVMKGATAFFLDTLVEEPTHHWLVTAPSMSPEHGGLTIGPTMDMSILRDLFAQTAQAAEILGVDAEFQKQVLATRQRLAPFQVGKFGQLQEWLTDLDNMKDAHRHLSHLYGLFPGAQITREGDAKIFDAAKTSLISRGMGATGWSLAWKENLWARVGDGEKAYALLVTQLTPPKGGGQGGGTFPNMFDAHPPFQIDGNFAATSAVAEMLLQSHEGFLRLLPALPAAWPDGRVEGLVARGGFVVGMTWRGGKLSAATVESRVGGDCRIRMSGEPRITQEDGAGVDARRDGEVIVFSTHAGGRYRIRP